MNLRDEKLQKLFIEKIIMKIINDFTGDSAAKKSAVKFLHDCFGDSIDGYNFIRWLPKKMNYKPIRLFNLLKNCEKLPASKNVLPCDIHEKIYQFWLHPETSLVSTDRREGRDKIKISKLNYLNRQLNAIQEDNVEEQTIALKKTGNKKTFSRSEISLYKKCQRIT